MNRRLTWYELKIADLSLSMQAFEDPEKEFCQHFEGDTPPDCPEAPLHGCIWPAAEGLANYLWQQRTSLLAKTVLEIGCGLALPGLLSAKAGAEVIAIDHQVEAETLLRINAQKLGVRQIRFQAASFTSPILNLGTFDYIIASDILYDPEQYSALEDFLLRHVKSGTTILIADPGRYAVSSFGSRLKKIASYQVQQQSLPGKDTAIEIHVFSLSA